MARKNVGLRYGEFEFPAEQGFSGSAGVQQVRGYQRGGRVKSSKKYGGKMTKQEAAMQAPPYQKGQKKMQMGGYMGPQREIEVDDVKISVPKKRGGKMSTSAKLRKAGKEMGYAYGGYAKAKDVSAEFKEKRGPQDTMDTGVQPARRGRTQQEIEAGGTKRLKPGLKKGGKVRYQKGGEVEVEVVVGNKTTRKSNSGTMHKTEKAKGGLAKYAKGGYAEGGKWIQSAIKKPGALRKSLKVKAGQKIPAKKLAAAAKKPGKMGQRARLAQTLKKLG